MANDITYEVRVLGRELERLQRDLEESRRDVERLGAADATIDIEMTTREFDIDRRRIEQTLSELERHDVSIPVDIQESELRRLHAELAALKQRYQVRVDMIVKSNEAEGELKAIQSRIREIDRMRASAEADVNTARAVTKLASLEREIRKLSLEAFRLHASVDVDDDDLRRLEARLSRLRGETASARVVADTAYAMSQINSVQRALVALGLRKAEVKVDVDTGAAIVELKAVETAVDGLTRRFDTSLGEQVRWVTNLITLFTRQAIAAAVAGLEPLGAAAVVAASGIGALGGAFGLLLAAALPSINALSEHETATNKVKSEQSSATSAARSYADATRAVSDAQKNAAEAVGDATEAYRDSVAAISEAREASREGVADAVSSYRDSLASLADTQRQGAESVRDAESSLNDARRAYADAQRQGAEQVADAIDRVREAEREEADTRRQVAAEIAEAYRSWREAVAAIREAEVEAARDIRDAYSTWRDAVRGVREAEVEAARDVRDAYETWRDAVEDVREAEIQAHEDIRDAIESHRDAVRDLADAREQAARDIAAAEEAAADAVDRVRDAETSLADARRAAMEATRAFAEAQRDLNDAMNSEPMRQAESIIDVKQAQLDAKRIKSQLADLQRQRQEALAVGDLDKAEALELQIAQLQLNQWQNSIDLKRAQQELNETRKHGSDELQAARDAVEAAYRDQIEAVHAVLDGEKALVEARRAAREAEQDIAAVRLDAARQIQEAEKRVAETQQAIDEARLDGARSVADAQEAARDAYQDYLRAQIEGERRVRDAQEQARDALQAYIRAQREGQRSVREAQEAARQAYIEYVRTQIEGAREIREAERGVADAKAGVAEAQEEASRQIAEARRQEIEASRAVAQAEKERIRAIREAKVEVGRAYAEIDEARESGAERVAEAEENAADALENLKRTQSDARDQIVSAQRDQRQAAKDYQLALEDLSKAQEKVGATLTASQQALLDAWKDFSEDFRREFRPANDAINMLGVRVLEVASTYLPRLGDAALLTVRAVARAFEYLVGVLQMPVVDNAINEILAWIPSITESALRATSNLLGSLLIIMGKAMPLVQQFFSWLDKVTRRFLDWLNTAEGQNALLSFLREIKKDAPIILDAVVKIARGFMELAGSKEARTFFREFVTFVGNLGAALPSLRFVFLIFNQLLKVLNRLPKPLRDAATSALAMYTAFAFLGGGLLLEGLFRFIGLLLKLWIAGRALRALGLPTVFESIGKGLRSLLGGVGRTLAAIPRMIGRVLSGLARGIGDALGALGRGIASALRSVGSGIARLAGAAGDALASVARFISTGASRIFGPIAGLISRFVSGVSRALGGRGLLGVLGRVAGAIAGGSFLRVISSALLGPAGLVFLFVDATSRIVENNKHLRGAMFEIPGFAQTMVNAMTGQLFGAVKGYIQFRNSIGGILKSIGGALTSFGKGVGEFFSRLPKWIGDAVSGIGKWIRDAFEWVGASTIAGWLQGIYKHAQKIIDYLVELAKAALKAAKSALGIRSPSREFAKLGEQIALGLAQGIRAQTKEARKAAREMAAGVEADARARAQVRLAGATPPASASPALGAAHAAIRASRDGKITRREMREMMEEIVAGLPKKPMHIPIHLDGEKIGEAVIEDVNADYRVALRRGYHPGV